MPNLDLRMFLANGWHKTHQLGSLSEGEVSWGSTNITDP